MLIDLKNLPIKPLKQNKKTKIKLTWTTGKLLSFILDAVVHICGNSPLNKHNKQSPVSSILKKLKFIFKIGKIKSN